MFLSNYNPESKTIRDWTISPIYDDSLDSTLVTLEYQIIGRYKGKSFRSNAIRRILHVGGRYMYIQTYSMNVYKLYFQHHFEPTYMYKTLYNYEWQYIYNDENSRFKITGYLDRHKRRIWYTTPVAFIENIGNGILHAHTESGSVYRLHI